MRGAAWRCVVVHENAWWCAVVCGSTWYAVLRGAWRCMMVRGAAWWYAVVRGAVSMLLHTGTRDTTHHTRVRRRGTFYASKSSALGPAIAIALTFYGTPLRCPSTPLRHPSTPVCTLHPSTAPLHPCSYPPPLYSTPPPLYPSPLFVPSTPLQNPSTFPTYPHTHTHTHTYICVYIYVYMYTLCIHTLDCIVQSRNNMARFLVSHFYYFLSQYIYGREFVGDWPLMRLPCVSCVALFLYYTHFYR